MRHGRHAFSSQSNGRWSRISSGSVSAVKMMNSAMPRLRVFVAATDHFTWRFLSKVTRHTFICPFLELLVGGSLLHQIKNLGHNIIRLEKCRVEQKGSFAPDCSSRRVQEARLFLGYWDQTFLKRLFGGDLTLAGSLVE
jgi:hypothetical protein